MLNIYKYHTNPEIFSFYEKAMECIPDLFWEKYGHNPEELKKREGAIATSAEYSYRYANYVLKGRFELGEEIIATDVHYSYFYAYYVLKGRFELAEKTILNSGFKPCYLAFIEGYGIAE